MIAALLLALFQAPATVGDTIWVTTRVPLQPRQILRPQSWDLGDIGQVLGPPLVTLTADSAIVRYPVAIWYPGDHPVTVPGPIVVNPEGRSDTLAAHATTISVRSVLPAGAAKDTLAPRDPAGVVVQAEPSILPLGILWLVLAIVAVAIGLWLRARRRPRPVPPATRLAEPDLPAMLARWTDAGEARAALDGWARLVAQRSEGRGGDPDGGTEHLLHAIDAIGFRADAEPAEVTRVIRAAKDWLEAHPR